MEWGRCSEERVTICARFWGPSRGDARRVPAPASHPAPSVICWKARGGGGGGGLGVGGGGWGVVPLDKWSEKVLSLGQRIYWLPAGRQGLIQKDGPELGEPAVRCVRAQVSEAFKEAALQGFGVQGIGLE